MQNWRMKGIIIDNLNAVFDRVFLRIRCLIVSVFLGALGVLARGKKWLTQRRKDRKEKQKALILGALSGLA